MAAVLVGDAVVAGVAGVAVAAECPAVEGVAVGVAIARPAAARIAFTIP